MITPAGIRLLAVDFGVQLSLTGAPTVQTVMQALK